MPRPIDADALKTVLDELLSEYPRIEGGGFAIGGIRKGIAMALRAVCSAPTLDYAPVRHGEWIKETGMAPPEFQGRHKCSLCFHYALSWKIGREELSPFCPNCGARMDGEK